MSDGRRLEVEDDHVRSSGDTYVVVHVRGFEELSWEEITAGGNDEHSSSRRAELVRHSGVVPEDERTSPVSYGNHHVWWSVSAPRHKRFSRTRICCNEAESPVRKAPTNTGSVRSTVTPRGWLLSLRRVD